MFIFKYKIPHVFLLALVLSTFLLAGCDNDSDPVTVSGSSDVPISGDTASLNTFLTAAIHDEYKARDTYRAVINTLGQVRPFVNIINAEEQHISLLANLFNSHGLSVPQDTVGGLPSPASLGAACSLGVQAEIDNAALYDSLLSGTTNYPDVQAVFRQLQSASLDQHLPAFQRCAN